MKFNIIHEIRRMDQEYHRKYGCRGEIICLDAGTESRIASYLIDSCYRFPYTGSTKLIDEVLEYGIRDRESTVCGMRFKFDCSSFCIDGPKPEWVTYRSTQPLFKFNIKPKQGIPNPTNLSDYSLLKIYPLDI